MSKKEKYSKSTIRLLFNLSGKIKKELIIGVFLSTGFMLLNIYLPIILKNIIDNEISPTIGIIDLNRFLWMSVFYLFMNLMFGLMQYVLIHHYKKTSNKIAYILRGDLFKHIVNLPMSFFDKTPVGKITSRTTSDINEFKQLFYIGFTTVVNAVFYLIGSIVYISFTNPKALYIVLVPIPIFILTILSYNKYQSNLNIKYRKIKSTITSDLNEIIKGANIIQAYAVCEPVEEEFVDKNKELYTYGKKIELFDSFFSYNITDMLRLMSIIAILYFAGMSNLRGNTTFTVGYILILIQYTSQIYAYLTRLMNRLNVFEKGMSSLEHINTILLEEQEDDGFIAINNIKGQVEFKNVYHEYIEDSPVLQDINFKREPGSSTAIVGSTGSGKSSIISLLFKFYSPYKGQILIDDQDIQNIRTADLRKHMALVLQDPILFKGSLRYNITLGDDYTDQEIKEALIKSGGESILSKLKDGLDTNLLGEDGGLSLGEKQIVNFARTIIRDPSILVLDEATASIDTETEQHIQKGLEALMTNRTSFIVAHRLSTIKNCDSIIVIDSGKIIESGSHDELMEMHGKYYELVQAQS